MTKLPDDLKQELYLLADEMRSMATLGNYFGHNIYEIERAHRMLELAIKTAALADDDYSFDDIKAVFTKEAWMRATPISTVEAVVFNAEGAMLLLKRRDNSHWVMPGGIAEVGHTLPESALRELWEEAGLRGDVVRLLGMFDNRLWGSRAVVHSTISIFHIHCDDLSPVVGSEMLDYGFFKRDALPTPLHRGHDVRIPKMFELMDNGATHFDSATSNGVDMPMFQRPDSSD